MSVCLSRWCTDAEWNFVHNRKFMHHISVLGENELSRYKNRNTQGALKKHILFQKRR
jgi:hypothetical protein